MQRFIDLFSKHNELRVIDIPLDIYLEIPHLAYLEAKKPNGGKALLFTHPIDKKNQRDFNIPVAMNLFGSKRRVELILGCEIDEASEKLQRLLNFKQPRGFSEVLESLSDLFSLRHIFPKKKRFFRADSQKNILLNNDIDLYKFPILTTWERDGGPFITMGQVYTQSLDGNQKNLGMYRLQVYDKNHLGLHWQIHKDSQHFFHEYKKANKKMPVSIGLGGDLLYTWCGQAPLPCGIYELMLYGFIREKNASVIKCITNPLFVPSDCDIVIEGWVDPSLMRDEGPFGDHTGFYTPIEPYPVLEISAITHKDLPIFPATVVGKPPLEDKYMGYLTERIFLPLIQKTAHGLKDMCMPENGVFHNLILVKISPEYPAHAKQLMHSLWGVGQMSFVKHAIFLGEDAPDFNDTEALMMYILNRFDVKNLVITEGICDALDHASPDFAFGGKLGLDVTEKEKTRNFVLYDDVELCEKLQLKIPEVKLIKQYFVDAFTPICIIGIQKERRILDLLDNLDDLLDSLGIVVFIDEEKNDIHNPYMLVWRITNNIDAKRDIKVIKNSLFIDATDKGLLENHLREWPKETDCNLEVLKELKNKGLLDGISDKIIMKYQVYNSPRSYEKCRL